MHFAYAAHAVPPLACAKNIFEPKMNNTDKNLLMTRQMQEACQHQIRVFDVDTNPWKQVKGPITAMFATLARLK